MAKEVLSIAATSRTPHADFAASFVGVMNADIEQETYQVWKASIPDPLCNTKVAQRPYIYIRRRSPLIGKP